jgi:hypothetical protein
MPFKTFADGQRVDDTDLDRYFIQQAHIIKGSDESRASTTTLTAVSDLVLPLLANTQYWMELFIMYGAIQAADISVGFTVPAGTTYDMTHGGLRTGHTAGDGFDNISRFRHTVGSSATAAGKDAAVNTAITVVPIEGTVVTAGTAGNLAFTWAQATSSGTATVVKANSLMILQRLTV